jgi:ankyrin repeat protein
MSTRYFVVATLVALAAIGGANPTVQPILRANSMWDDGETALLIAAASGHVDTLRLLIDAGSM